MRKKHIKPISKIALFLPPDSLAIREVESGFLETLIEKGIKYDFSLYNACSDAKANEKEMHEVVRQEYDLIFALGIACAQAAKKVTIHTKKHIPIVFCGVGDPVKEQLIQSKTCSETHLTGTFFAQTDLTITIRYLLWLAPQLKRILCLYDTSCYKTDKTCVLPRKTVDFFAQKEITVCEVSIERESDLHNKVPAYFKNVDAVITTRGHLFFLHMETLAALAYRYGIVLCASDFESVRKGATLAVGDVERNTGIATALHYAFPILTQEKTPAQLRPRQLIWDYKLLFNAHAARFQKHLPVDQTINKVMNFKNGLLC